MPLTRHAGKADGGPGSRRLKRKDELRRMLRDRDLAGIDRLSMGHRNAGGLLLSIMLYEPDELIRWRGVESLGRMATAQTPAGLENLRELIRRMLWLMNDESGGVGWFAPEAIGEIIACAPPLIDEYGLLLTSFLTEEPFERGAHWAVARAAGVKPGPLAEAAVVIGRSVGDPDPFIRAHATRALAALGESRQLDRAADLLADQTAFRVYDFGSGDMVETTVAAVAGEAFRSCGMSPTG